MLVSHAQGEANIWYFGNKAGLDFNSGSPVALTNGQMNTNEGCAVISDATGNLLFYTDGITVYNKWHNTMVNGNDLMGHPSSAQSATIVQKPGVPNLYYIFTTDSEHNPNGFRYSVVDMTLNSGDGAVTSEKNVLVYTPTIENLGVTRHANGIDYWIITHEWNNNNFRAYLLTASGVNYIPVVTSIGLPIVDRTANDYTAAGTLKISPSGSKLALASVSDFAQLFDFNNATGALSNDLTLITEPGDLYGAAFSPDESLLYISNTQGKIHQFNLNDSDIPNSRITIFDIVNGLILYPGQMQVGPDSKIYVSFYGKSKLGVITLPNISGTGCNLQIDAVDLAGRMTRTGLPSFNQSIFYNPSIRVQNACAGELVNMSFNNSNITSALWQFGDGNTSTNISPTHTYSLPGTYIITLQASGSYGTGFSSRQITISSVPTASTPPGIIVCDDNNDGFYNFDLTQNILAILNGQSTSQYGVRFFSNLTDYANNIPITTPTVFINAQPYAVQPIIAEVYNLENNSCGATTGFNIQVVKSPQPQSVISSIEKCDDTSFGTDNDGRVVFNLNSRLSDILNGQAASEFTVQYYKDAAYLNEITTPNGYINTNQTETIYVKVFNNLHPDCVSYTRFSVSVSLLPLINNSITLKQCDDDNDDYTFFNLNELQSLISTSSNFTFSYHELQADAEANVNPISNLILYRNQTASNDLVFVRIANSNGCYKVISLNLIVTTTKIPNSLDLHYYSCDSTYGTYNDGLATFDFSDINAQIISLYPSGQLLDITYYQNITDALSEQNAIDNISAYVNTESPNVQNIFIRVENRLNNECVGVGHHITLHVEPVPTATPLNFRKCDDNYDGIFAFDITLLEQELINGLTNVSVNYYDDNGNLIILTSPFITSTQTITAVIKNNYGSGCDFSVPINFEVNTLPQIFPIPDNLIKKCDTEIDSSLHNGTFSFDTSGFEDLLIGNQTGLIVKYFTETGVQLSTPLPNPLIIKTQDIIVEVSNPLNPLCSTTSIIPFTVYPVPYNAPPATEIICKNDPLVTKTINAGLIDESESNLSSFTYKWYHNGNLVTGQNDYELIVNSSGTYIVEITNINGCISNRTVLVEDSSIAAVENLEILDFSDQNKIIINVTGNGEYEYRLDNTDYQNSNIFNNIEPGIYTVYVRDNNGCGIISQIAPVLGIPKFFTPNGDGENDIWHIKGATLKIIKNSTLNIYDRFGKLIKQITPKNLFWDGTFNGKPLPSSDYWYILNLNDGRIVRGHFSLIR